MPGGGRRPCGPAAGGAGLFAGRSGRQPAAGPVGASGRAGPTSSQSGPGPCHARGNPVALAPWPLTSHITPLPHRAAPPAPHPPPAWEVQSRPAAPARAELLQQRAGARSVPARSCRARRAGTASKLREDAGSARARAGADRGNALRPLSGETPLVPLATRGLGGMALASAGSGAEAPCTLAVAWRAESPAAFNLLTDRTWPATGR
jgi:hypothetical protein